MAGRKPVVQCTASEWRDMCRRVHATIAPPDGYLWRFTWSRAVGKEGKEGDCELVHPRGGCPKCGHHETRRGTAHVRVEKGLSRAHTEAVLLHEVAHAFDLWSPHGWKGDHHDDFYLWLGRVERRYHGQETG